VSPDTRERFLYLTTTGRVSGQPRTIEIWFVERTGRYYIVAERREAAQWVQNLERNPLVRFRVGARDEEGPAIRAKARTVREPDLVATVSSLMNAKYGWSDGLVVELLPDT
jgi:deazaflavin-dependent oxidoreductase (nitroreductase family)